MRPSTVNVTGLEDAKDVSWAFMISRASSGDNRVEPAYATAAPLVRLAPLAVQRSPFLDLTLPGLLVPSRVTGSRLTQRRQRKDVPHFLHG